MRQLWLLDFDGFCGQKGFVRPAVVRPCNRMKQQGGNGPCENGNGKKCLKLEASGAQPSLKWKKVKAKRITHLAKAIAIEMFRCTSSLPNSAQSFAIRPSAALIRRRRFARHQSSQGKKSSSPPPSSQPTPHDIPPHAGPKSFVVGVLGGTLGSFVGIGGGVFTIPILTSSSLRLTQRQANASNLVAVAATGFAGASAYALAGVDHTNSGKEGGDVPQWRESNVQMDMAMAAAMCGMVTARMGAKISNRLSERTLKRGLAAVMYTAAPAVHLQSFLDDSGSKETQMNDITFGSLPAAIIGSGAGIFSGITGLGGGIITVSAFTLFTDLTYKQALGTSLCAMVLPASVGAITHHFNGNVVWRVAPYLAAGAACGAFGGGTIGSNLPEKELKCCFSAAMIALGTRVLLRA